MEKKKGFTLIELLVVIAIIGILSSIVLVSLGGAREKAKDARMQAGLSQVRAIAELINSDYNSYENLCDADNTLNQGAPSPYDTQLGAIENDLVSQRGLTLNSTNYPCFANATSYCVAVDLNSTAAINSWFCINSIGQAITTSTRTCTSAGDTDCNL